MDRITSFKPIVGESPKVLILGSMPSVKSLEKKQYYGFLRNDFWKIMADILDFDRNMTYEDRTEAIKKAGIALWDVIGSCEREGSLDKDIKNDRNNDIEGFLEQYPTITHIVLNGTKAYQSLKRYFPHMVNHYNVVKMYSTSPANAIKYEKKFEQWQVIKDFLIDRDNIVLIGMPGAGKSTVGVVLAKALGFTFIDTDLIIQEREHRLLQEIIDEKGMDALLKAEEEAVLSVDCHGAIVATGGSVVYSEAAMAHLSALGKVVYLEVAYEEIERRISNITTRGIAIREGATLRDIYNERVLLYNRYGQLKVSCDGHTIEETIEKVIGVLYLDKSKASYDNGKKKLIDDDV